MYKTFFLEFFFSSQRIRMLEMDLVLFLIIVYSTVLNQLKDANHRMEEIEAITRLQLVSLKCHLSMPLGLSTDVKEGVVLHTKVME